MDKNVTVFMKYIAVTERRSAGVESMRGAGGKRQQSDTWDVRLHDPGGYIMWKTRYFINRASCSLCWCCCGRNETRLRPVRALKALVVSVQFEIQPNYIERA